jgi:hypothetical protein
MNTDGLLFGQIGGFGSRAWRIRLHGELVVLPHLAVIVFVVPSMVKLVLLVLEIAALALVATEYVVLAKTFITVRLIAIIVVMVFVVALMKTLILARTIAVLAAMFIIINTIVMLIMIVSGIPMTTVVMIYGTHVPAGMVNTIVRCMVVNGILIIMRAMNIVINLKTLIMLELIKYKINYI